MTMKRLNRAKGISVPHGKHRDSKRSSPTSASHRSRTSTSSAVSIRRQIFLSILILAVVAVFGSDFLSSVQSSLRRLSLKCIHTIYTTKELALNMPDFPKQIDLPSYVALCQELVQRDVAVTYVESFKCVFRQ
jgi:hypothetical protein